MGQRPPDPATSEPGRVLALRWGDADAHRVLSWLALLGLAAGIALAVAGLPGADLHGPLHRLGIMDPLCGATRGVRLAFLGDLSGAWRYNPLAILLSAATVAFVVRGCWGWLTGRWLNARLTWTPAIRITVVIGIAALWINQQQHAALLLNRF